MNIYEGQRWIVYHWLKGKCPAIPRTFSRLLLLSLCHVSVCVCVCLYVCPCAFNSLSRQPDGFLCLWASVVGPLSLSCDAIILSGAAVFLRKGSYFISSFCLGLNASGALSAIFARFNSLLHPNKNIHPRLGPITHVGPRKIATSSIGLISLTRFWTAVSTGLSGSLSCIFHQAYRTLPVESPKREREREREARMGASQSA